MPLFINRDQIFAHQVHLLEHKLRVSHCLVNAKCEINLSEIVQRLVVYLFMFSNNFTHKTQTVIFSLCFQSKEERILELETENAILHLRLAEVRKCLLYSLLTGLNL